MNLESVITWILEPDINFFEDLCGHEGIEEEIFECIMNTMVESDYQEKIFSLIMKLHEMGWKIITLYEDGTIVFSKHCPAIEILNDVILLEGEEYLSYQIQRKLTFGENLLEPIPPEISMFQ